MKQVRLNCHSGKFCAVERAFTLIELLVVISIISLLISILLPALKNARDAARTISCSSVLRQVGIVSSAYTTQNAGYYAPLSQPTATGNAHWPQNKELKDLIGVGELSDSWWWGRGNVCPDAVGSFVNKWGTQLDGHMARSYGMSPGKNWSSDKDMLWYNEYRGVRDADPVQPSRAMWYVDGKDFEVTRAGSDYAFYWDVHGDDVNTDYKQIVAYRHNEVANLLFYDGHALSMNKADVYPNDALWYIKNNP